MSDTVAEDSTYFIHEVKVHSGKHKHQGGIQLFVLDGEGYTVVDGKKMEWEKWVLGNMFQQVEESPDGRVRRREHRRNTG